jgi:hypothetical protein
VRRDRRPSHEEVEVLTEDFFSAVSGQFKESVIGKNDRIASFRGIHEHHWHARCLCRNDERTQVLTKAIDVCLSVFLTDGFDD